jgi:glycosyltransferase involved in cell wall biosynthesis
MTVSLSVITCSHNPRPDYLKQVIDALKDQTLDKARWEYLFIDNASANALDAQVDLSWHPHARHVREEQLGLTHARLCGIREATGEILVFVDDDNVLDADYLEQVIAVSEQHPTIGAWGGQRRPVFEQEPPAWSKRHWSHLAIHEFEQDSWANLPDLPNTTPNGAGLCVRKAVADYYARLHESGRRDFILDRAGSSLISGGDVDLASCACDLGLGVGLFASMKLAHLIPKERLEEDYLLRLAEGVGYSGVILNSFRSTSVLAPRSWSRKAADFLRFLRKDAHERRIYRAQQRGERQAQRDLLTASRNGQSKNAK